ncbi:uncharacterized protein LOC124514257 [Lynx rufus]|uniref:uncharacterized protein LOC124514256 n=1 Tax=Lynx rufus TaxID=61384 RepID=UPI001F126033|nr:uncharacterized protein LOC124514256 [Lynx rufus]XP_046938246.1 uncharacterized protein LOC124514257 [Lynx rufus]
MSDPVLGVGTLERPSTRPLPSWNLPAGQRNPEEVEAPHQPRRLFVFTLFPVLKAPLKVAVVTPSLTTSLFGRLQGSPPKNHSKRQVGRDLPSPVVALPLFRSVPLNSVSGSSFSSLWSVTEISLERVGRGPPVSGFKAAQAGARGTPFAQRTPKRLRSAGRAAGRRRANGLAEEERAPDVCPGAPRPRGGHPAFGAIPEARPLRALGSRPRGAGGGAARGPLPGPLGGRGLLARRGAAVSRALGGSSEVGGPDSCGRNAAFGG